jgi:hypothetical protein
MIKKVLELWMMIISSMILELTQLTVMTDNDGHSPRHYAQVLILNFSYAIGNSVTSSFLNKLSQV